ncbi:2OG-Fe(II) oxygenase [Caulobacter sp. 17J65-9]|nr:2OG-Fe(II) oxygenase [Caulobacter sp. 17J65-9]
MEAGFPVLDLEALRQAEVKTDPYVYLHGTGVVRPEMIAAVQASFPDIRTTGFHPVEDYAPHGAFGELIDELRGEALNEVLSDKFGIDFTALPQLITIRKLSAAHEGRIHTDGDKKVMSLLIYLNDAWDSPAGRFRVLRGKDDFEDYAAEVPPETGAFVAFLRADNSWHGHTPFVGERRVVQVAWLRSQEDVDRKRRTHGVLGALKRIWGRPAGTA